MNLQRERRLGVDRREHAIYYRYGAEHRENVERRATQIIKEKVSPISWVISLRDVVRLMWRGER